MSTLPQLEEKIYNLVPELVHKTHNSTHHRYDYSYDEIHIEHIMKVLGNGWAFSFYPGGYVLLKMASNGSYYKYWHGDDNKGTFIVYEEKPLLEQSKPFRTWLEDQLPKS